ncbi:NADH dehydrogenase [ubiquinone] 1 alpha subcomplex assembly factor 2-like [Uloborus diversus]|uniref:NADH dehydrogenase [ubiquinone] 1 alpha subcomplex assembly factor 2-like n=1 Tax=Uloborus diversus TaxID=327109 RepID=UPI0024096850|nr:NADH dehydrogenase [ubiquinone] 1 alpha subcomplex assembly factor 2-like [Uloborus diversus]
MAEGRSVWRLLWSNMRQSLKILPVKGKLVGEDHLGNRYFEGFRDPKVSSRPVSRWFVPKDGEWQQNLPAEWEAWIRGRRLQPPTQEEVEMNLAIAKTKKLKGDQIEAEAALKRRNNDSFRSQESSSEVKKGFPHLDGLEKDPGESFDKKR